MNDNRKQYRITFYPTATVRIDPFEFAWLLSKHELEVVAKADNPDRLFVQESYDNIGKFIDEVNRTFGPLLFEEVAVSVPGEGYVSIESDAE